MPRQPRLVVPGFPLHVVARGVNRSACFVEERDFATYRGWLLDLAQRTGCEVHAFVLMTNHVHILLTGMREHSVSEAMKRLGVRYVRYFNDRRGRTGPPFEGRFRSSLVRDEAGVLACIRYIELNPVRAGMIGDPARYRWSTCAAHLGHAPLSGWVPHPSYLALASRADIRAAEYRRLLYEPIERGYVEAIDAGVRSGRATQLGEPTMTEPAQAPGVAPGGQTRGLSPNQSGRRYLANEARGCTPSPAPCGSR